MEIGQHFTMPPGRYRTVGKQAEIVATAPSGVYYAYLDDMAECAGLVHRCAHFLPFHIMSSPLPRRAAPRNSGLSIISVTSDHVGLPSCFARHEGWERRGDLLDDDSDVTSIGRSTPDVVVLLGLTVVLLIVFAVALTM